jgi:hypothetical protein
MLKKKVILHKYEPSIIISKKTCLVVATMIERI